ncbi:MAG: hypothetical protein JWM76_4540 [Pseudonocardiales bacterium]|nr:hypothetical protein [Pseudonocardiales bacterium]
MSTFHAPSITRRLSVVLVGVGLSAAALTSAQTASATGSHPAAMMCPLTGLTASSLASTLKPILPIRKCGPIARDQNS